MIIQEELEMAIKWFCKDIGVPANLIVDAHQAQAYIKIDRLCDQLGMILNILEEGTPWANRDELYIGLFKDIVHKDMHALHSPIIIWDYSVERCYLIHNKTSHLLFQNNGLTPHEMNLGALADISNLCVYDSS